MYKMFLSSSLLDNRSSESSMSLDTVLESKYLSGLKQEWIKSEEFRQCATTSINTVAVKFSSKLFFTVIHCN